jgi:hypothetical protein
MQISLHMSTLLHRGKAVKTLTAIAGKSGQTINLVYVRKCIFLVWGTDGESQPEKLSH